MSGGPPSVGRRPRWLGAGSASEDGLGVPLDLVGVRRDIVAGLRTGDALRVSVNANGATVCTTPDGGVVGALVAFAGLSRIIQRLGSGHAYVARVEELTPTSCRVSLAEV